MAISAPKRYEEHPVLFIWAIFKAQKAGAVNNVSIWRLLHWASGVNKTSLGSLAGCFQNILAEIPIPSF